MPLFSPKEAHWLWVKRTMDQRASRIGGLEEGKRKNRESSEEKLDALTVTEDTSNLLQEASAL